MFVLRLVVYCSLIGHFQCKAKHIYSKENSIADALSRANFQRFRQLAPTAEIMPRENTRGIFEPFKDEV